MLNVGSGGGRLDNWDENWPRKDYEEFSVSQDEFGFILVVWCNKCLVVEGSKRTLS